MYPKFLSRCLQFITLATLAGPTTYGLYRREHGNCQDRIRTRQSKGLYPTDWSEPLC
jgi:hypothetical protein